MNAKAINLARRAASTAALQISHHRNQPVQRTSRRAFSASKLSPSETHHNHEPTTIEPVLPIAAFVDLDNVAPATHRREDAKQFVSPLIQFGQLINGDSNKELDSKTVVTRTYNKKFRPLQSECNLLHIPFENTKLCQDDLSTENLLICLIVTNRMQISIYFGLWKFGYTQPS